MANTAFIRWNDREDLKLYYLIIDTKTIAVLGAEVPDFVERFIDPLGNDLRRAVVRLGRIPEIEHTNILSTFETELKQMANTIFSIHILSREEIGTHEKELAIRLENSADAGAEHWRRLRESTLRELEAIDAAEYRQIAPPKGRAPQKPQAGSDSSEEKTRENFKFPDNQKGKIDLLFNILQDLKNGKYQKKISEKYGFDPSLWHKGGENAGIGKYLPVLKKRAKEYKNDNKTRLIRRSEGDDIDSTGEFTNDSDYLFCAHLLGAIDEEELDLEKDINRREIPRGILGDRGKWE